MLSIIHCNKINFCFLQGLKPFIVVGTLGTTATGAIDDLSELSILAREFNAWFHVDAAYGGFFALVDEVKSRMKGIEFADSVCADAHKSLFLPQGTALLLVRNKKHLSDLNRVQRQAHYLDRKTDSNCEPSSGSSSFPVRRRHSIDDDVDNENQGSTTDLSPIEKVEEAEAATGPHWSTSIDYSPELSRYFRGFRVWFPLLFHGTNFFENLLREKLTIAKALQEKLLTIPNVEVGSPPQLSIVYFRFVKKELASERYNNDVNKTIFSIVKNDGWVYFTTIELDGKIWLRIAVLNYQSCWDHVQDALDKIMEAHREIEKNRSLGSTLVDG